MGRVAIAIRILDAWYDAWEEWKSRSDFNSGALIFKTYGIVYHDRYLNDRK